MAKPLSRKGALAMGALAVYLNPKLAADAAIDLPAVLKPVTGRNWKSQKPKVVERLKVAVSGKLAADADIEDVVDLLDTLDDVTEEVADVVAEEKNPDDEQRAADADEEEVERLRAFLASKGMSDEDIDAAIAAMSSEAAPAAEDKTPEAGKPVPVTKAAMDAAITAASTAAERRAMARMQGVREAERAVRPYVGELAVAQDSADAVYEAAFGIMKVDVKGVHPSAYPTILKLQPVPGETRATAGPARVAMDAAQTADYAKRFPDANRLKR